MAEILVYGADWCGDCRRSKRLLERRGVEFSWIDVEADPRAAEEARRVSGRRNIPVIVMPGGEVLVEPSDPELDGRLRA
ncbi:MAG TPA: glutaredoxin family protein [Actinomycetota bacterium]|nr:glutaredoxin family protein [Actinomycetota bacterium]